MGERDGAAKQEALRRLSEPEGDHELHSALERMKEHHPHLWEVLHRVHLSTDSDPSKLEKWRKAPAGSEEDIWAEHYDEAMGPWRWPYSRSFLRNVCRNVCETVPL